MALPAEGWHHELEGQGPRLPEGKRRCRVVRGNSSNTITATIHPPTATLYLLVNSDLKTAETFVPIYCAYTQCGLLTHIKTNNTKNTLTRDTESLFKRKRQYTPPPTCRSNISLFLITQMTHPHTQNRLFLKLLSAYLLLHLSLYWPLWATTTLLSSKCHSNKIHTQTIVFVLFLTKLSCNEQVKWFFCWPRSLPGYGTGRKHARHRHCRSTRSCPLSRERNAVLVSGLFRCFFDVLSL